MKRLLRINILTFVFSALLFSGCIEDSKIDPGVKGAGKPIFKGGASFVSKTASSIEVEAEIEKENGSKITERGFCYGRSSSPTIENDDTIRDAGIGIGTYKLKIEGLTHDSEYFIRPYARNELGVEYGTELCELTNIGLGSVVTLKPEDANVLAGKALVGGEIKSAGEGEMKRRGVYYSMTPDLAVKDSVESTDETDTYSCRLTNLTASEKYYIRAYAENTYGLFVGGIDSFLTRDG
ncbi:MAG: fibronectin type III domain-containing protein, partial [Tannerella sp.]|nr:fibronectin type III domain-containing protein [Tannerella sp.]